MNQVCEVLISFRCEGNSDSKSFEGIIFDCSSWLRKTCNLIVENKKRLTDRFLAKLNHEFETIFCPAELKNNIIQPKSLNENIRIMSEICSNLTIKTTELRQ